MQIRAEDRAGAPWWTPRWWAQDVRWLALAAPGLIFAGHALYGAMLPKTALTLALLGALLLGACLAHPKLRRELGRLRGLALPAALFAAVIVAGLWSMTPFAPGGPHPVWAYVGISPGAATLDKSQTLLELIKLLGLGCLFGVGAASGGSDERARLTIHATLGLGVLLALWSFLSFAGGDLGPNVRRLGATFAAPNTAATLFGILFMLTIGAGISRARSAPSRARFSSTAPFAAAGLLFAVSLLATASRGGLVATAAGLLIFAALQVFSGKSNLSRATLGAAGGMIAGAVLLAFTGQELVARLMGEGWELAGRREVFEAHWQAFKGAPWMGYGLGSFDTLNRLLLDARNAGDIWTVRAAHNVYLTWLEQAGLLGALSMFAALALILARSTRNGLRRTRMTALIFALLAADVVVLAHGVTDFALETYSMAAFWSLLLGLQFALAQGSSRR
ncbi:O-antigen ligase family protein [Phenylobacterium sp.]|uniref:O-antigen ligase family protein n=1 Tax=Phenylobacterium sp. TaxID=1871053 RepID=UPI002FE38826